ncbi:MAG TPA: anthranilate phosphoribosyltransferase [Thermoplasmata archaeon]|nr:anthranilate phosphoribosyltransferase [Thermoplasmata archaeon]
MIATYLERLHAPRPLIVREVRGIFDLLLAPSTSEVERVGLLRALTLRHETPHELALLASEMRRRARPFRVPPSDRAVDLCGSGGARRPSFNVSTVSAFVVAAAGTPVVKHGNRSTRGPCGSSDLLAALGLPIDSSIPFARASYARYRIAFLHAPLFHPATRAVASARRALGIPTIFNRLGPLSNPAGVSVQVVGVPNLSAAGRVATALRRLGVRRGLAMTSEEGCDEFSPQYRTRGVRWDPRGMHRVTVVPSRYLEPDERRGDWGPLPPPAAAEETERILAGGGGARRGAVVLTSGAVLWVAGRTSSLAQGVDRAREALDGGGAESLLADLRRLARRFPAPAEA